MTSNAVKKINIVYKDVKDLREAEYNPRKINLKQIEQLKKSLTNFDCVEPLVINIHKDRKNVIVGGHQRLRVLRELKYQEVPCVEVDLPLAQERELNVRLNKNTGDFDYEALAKGFEISDLMDWGFTEEDFSFLKEEPVEGLCDPDDVPEAPEKPITVLGDVWVLGNHRVMCGDSTSADNVSKLLGDIKPHLMVTDPPYGVSYDASWREGHDLNIGKKIGGKFSPRATGKVENDDRADWTEAWALFPGNIAYVWHGGLHSSEVAKSLEACDFNLRAQIIWVKQHFVFGRGDYHWQHEPCWYAVKSKGNWAGDRKQTTVWQINNNNPFGTGGKAEEKVGHSTQKPVECMKRPIENNSSPGQAIYEPFCGSGTTVIAAEMTGRHCYAMELSPQYCDVIVKRWQKFTGKQAVHAETNQLFGEAQLS